MRGVPLGGIKHSDGLIGFVLEQSDLAPRQAGEISSASRLVRYCSSSTECSSSPTVPSVISLEFFGASGSGTSDRLGFCEVLVRMEDLLRAYRRFPNTSLNPALPSFWTTAC